MDKKRMILEELINELRSMNDEEFINFCIKDGYRLISYTPGKLGSITLIEDEMDFSYETKVKNISTKSLPNLEFYNVYCLEDVA